MARTFDEVSVGDTLGPVTIPVTRAALVAYAGASLDQNPIHQDEDFAKSVGLPDVIAHGMWTMGAAERSSLIGPATPGGCSTMALASQAWSWCRATAPSSRSPAS